MRFSLFVPTALVMVAWAPSLVAQVPQLLNYQGRVKVSGADFSGTGQFKFALVSGAGSTTYWSNDGTSSNGGQPAAAVALTVSGGLYSVLLGDATLPNMTALTPGVFSNSEVRLRVWFSDNVNGWQQLAPDQRVAAVGYALMADEVKDGAVTAAKLAEGAVTSSKLAAGAVTSTALASNAVIESLAAAGQGTVPSGAALVSVQPNAPGLLAAGYFSVGSLNSADSWTSITGGTARDRAASVWTGSEMLIWGDGSSGWRYNPTTNVWKAMSVVGQPAGRENPLAVWTGTEMIVWGGRNVSPAPPISSGGRYHPGTDTWTTMSLDGAPEGRFNSTAVWTGSEMLIWGGNNGTTVLGDGARYNPTIGTGGKWTAFTAATPPPARQLHTAVWTGTEMIIHGGQNPALGTYGDCYIFNPSGAGLWTLGAVATGSRSAHTAVWTGRAMLVFGGANLGAALPVAGGLVYTRSSNSWAAMSTAGIPTARTQHGAVWTGNEMIVWGGTSSAASFVYDATGGRYDPANNSWTALTNIGAPAARVNPNMVWSGSEMIIWGGSNGTGFDAGGRYRPGQTFYIYQRP
jgi:N-acetylneuraminic acid mutarotase